MVTSSDNEYDKEKAKRKILIVNIKQIVKPADGFCFRKNICLSFMSFIYYIIRWEMPKNGVSFVLISATRLHFGV